MHYKGLTLISLNTGRKSLLDFDTVISHKIHDLTNISYFINGKRVLWVKLSSVSRCRG